MPKATVASYAATHFSRLQVAVRLKGVTDDALVSSSAYGADVWEVGLCRALGAHPALPSRLGVMASGARVRQGYTGCRQFEARRPARVYGRAPAYLRYQRVVASERPPLPPEARLGWVRASKERPTASAAPLGESRRHPERATCDSRPARLAPSASGKGWPPPRRRSSGPRASPSWALCLGRTWTPVFRSKLTLCRHGRRPTARSGLTSP